MAVSDKDTRNPAALELENKQLARAQVKQINRGLTRLKKISTPPKAAAPVDLDKTGSFIAVPVDRLVTAAIDEACDEAERTCSDSGIKLNAKKKKRWFNWAD